MFSLTTNQPTVAYQPNEQGSYVQYKRVYPANKNIYMQFLS
jgi:hypothetical protein